MNSFLSKKLLLGGLPRSLRSLRVTQSKQSLGIYGEKLARKFLESRNYKILHTNFITPFGEIDIIAREKTIIVFVEVKSRRSEHFGSPLESITFQKCKHIISNCNYYLLKNSLINSPVRIDGIGIKLTQNGDFEFLKHVKNIIEI